MRPVHLPQRFADFAYGGVGADGVDYVGHGVGVGNIAVGTGGGSLGGGLLQGIEAAPDFFVRAADAQGFEFRLLSAGYRFADVENVGRPFFDDEIIYADRDLLVRLNRALILVAGFGNFFLGISALDGFDHAAHLVELLKVVEGAVFHVEGLLLDEVAAAERIDRLGNARLEGNDLLGAQCDARGFFGRQGERFVVGVGVQRLRAAEHSRERLQGDTRDVVHRLLRGQRDAGGLRVETHQAGAIVFRAEAILHQAIPDFARGTVFGDLFEKIVVRVEKKAEARAEVVDVKAAAERPLDVFNAVIDGESEFLQRGRSRFANVIAADRDGVEARRKLRPELEGVNDQAHRGRGRIDVLLLRDVLLENVILQSAGNFLPVGALLFRNDQVHGPEHAGRRIDGHRCRDFFQGDTVEQDLHIFERINGHAALANFAFAGRVVGVVAHERGQIEGNGESAAAVFEKILVALVGFFGRGEAGEHAHRPQLAAVAGRVNAARVGRFARVAEVLLVVPVGGEIGLGAEAANRSVRNRAEPRVSVLVEVGAGGGAERV